VGRDDGRDDVPGVAPTVALYSRMTKARSALSPVAFTAGYLFTGAGVGALAFAFAGRRLAGNVLARAAVVSANR
jgi:hypothetical protein